MSPDPLGAAKGAAIVLAALVLTAGSATLARSEPALDRARAAGPLTVFPDAEVPGRFYYVPGPLELATRDERPAIQFLLTRYSGSRLTGDAGDSGVFGHLSFDIEQDAVGSEDIEAARGVLEAEGVSRPDLRRLPIRRTEAQVVFAPLGGGASEEVSGGAFENRDAAAGTFSRRRYTMRLDRYSAEALWRMLESERTLVSFSYTYVAEGATGSEEVLETSGGPGGAALGLDQAVDSDDQANLLRAVRSDSFAVTVDPERDAELIQVVDINADRPLQPTHGVLDIRCYDFRNGLRPGLAMKMVELEGTAANGRTARKTVIFRASEPDEAVHRLRFPFAVRLDEPLRYRVLEIATNGEQLDSGWQERSWVGVLDVTTSRERLQELEETRSDSAAGGDSGSIHSYP